MKPKFRRFLPAATIQLVLAVSALPAMAVVYDWDNGSTDGLWDTATNWNPDGLPSTGDNVLVTVDSAVTKTISLSATPTNPTILEVGLARTGNGTATVDHTGGTLTVTGWFNLGQGFAGTGDRNGSGIWNMSGDAVVNATHASGGQTTIGAGWTPTSYNTGILNISGNAWFNQTANAIHVGGENANLRAKGIINLSGNGKLTNASSLLVGVAGNGSTGVVNVADNATLTASRIQMGTNTGATGAIHQSGGTVSTTQAGANSLSLGLVTNGFGSYRISGGNLTSDEITVGAELVVGSTMSGGSGILDISGGTVNNTGWLVVNRMAGASSLSQSAVVNVSGGSLTYNGGGLVTNWGSSTTEAQFSAINVSGTGSISTGNDSDVRLGWGNSANNFSVLNLNGGTVTPRRVYGNQSYVNFNGGTLRANSAQGDFLAVTNAQVRSGGAIIDSNGFNITINQPLLAPTDNGVTTIAVTAGGSGYISAPILKISGGTGSGGTAIANMVDDGTGNGTFRIGSISVTGAGNYTVAPDFITQIGGAPTTAATFGAIGTAANSSGGLTKNGTGRLEITGANTFTGAVVVNGGELYVNRPNLPSNPMNLVSGITINNGATLRSTTNGLFGYGNSPQAPITVNAGGVLTMNDGADLNVGNITLAGGELAAIGTNHAVWGSYVFRNNQSVLSVTENSTVSAPNVLMQNGSSINVAAGKNLSFTGTLTNGTSGGTGILIKSGDGTVTLSNANTYTGVTTVSGGTLQVGNGTTDGSISNTSNVINNATLAFNLAGNQAFDKVISGSGTLTKAGAGTLGLSANNTYAGNTLVTAGTLQLSGTNTNGNLQVNGAGALTRITGGTTTLATSGGGSYIAGGGTLEIAGGALVINGGAAWFSVGDHPSLPDGAGTLTLTSGSFTNNNSWGITVGSGNAGTGIININGGTFTSNDAIQNGIWLGESAGGNGTLNLNGGVLITDRIRVGASGTGALNFNGGKLQATGDIADIVANNANLTTTIQAGGLKVGGTPNFTISEAMGGSGGLTKEDGNVVTLTGNSTYTGATQVNAGTLVVNGNNSAATGAVSVSSALSETAAVRLKGTGTIGGATTFAADPDGAGAGVGGIHSPGTSVGKQSFTDNLTYSDGSIFEWEIDRAATQTRGTGYDAVNVTGTLAGLDGDDVNNTTDAIFRIVIGDASFSDTFWSTNKSWTDIFTESNGTTAKSNWASIFGGGFQYFYNNGTTLTSIDAPDAGTIGSFTISGSTLTWSAVPEPTSALVGLLIGAGLLRRRRKF